MNKGNRVTELLNSLRAEIRATQAGSDTGQFPILDLIGNLRDEYGATPDGAALQTRCAEAWERMVKIVESGQPFSAQDIAWLNELVEQLPAGAASTPAVITPPVVTAVVAPPSPAPAAPPVGEEQAINLNIVEDGDLLREFITESREHLDNIEQGVLVLEREPADSETLNTVFRAFHTFKGGAGFLNLIAINRLAHVLESLLDLARQGKLTIDANVIELILRGRDTLKKFLDKIDGQVNGGQPLAPILVPTENLKREVQATIDGKPASAKPSVPAAPGVVIPIPSPVVASVETMEPHPKDTTTPIAPVAASPDESQKPKGPERSAMVKVDTGKLDGLLDLVGEMVIAQSLVGQDLGSLAGVTPQFARNMAQLSRITRDLQRVSMSLRMVPVRGAFQKMARVVRDISAKQNKQVDFITSGEDTELDRGVVEELGDPLLHMIRNSMDHGIESAEKRAAAGKPPIGKLDLRAYHQGGNIVVEIEDDGAGLNFDRILKKAIERGLTTAETPHTDEEIASYIFAAGFSTAETITEISGRGVGLDVVRRNIEKLRGHVNISSKPGQGTLFKITLPLTLAIIDGLIVKVGEERYIIPTLSVRESFRPHADMITRVRNRAEMVNVRGRLLPLLRLHELFGIKNAAIDPTNAIIVVAQSGPSLRCLLVDALLHKQEVVIKNINDMMVHKNRALAGATILGDGRVGLILDVNALVHLELEAYAKAA